MKTYALLAVLALGFPAAAAAQSATDHTQHQQHDQQKPPPAPSVQQPVQKPHQGEGQHDKGMKDECCCKKEQKDGKMPCCEKRSGAGTGSSDQHDH